MTSYKDVNKMSFESASTEIHTNEGDHLHACT